MCGRSVGVCVADAVGGAPNGARVASRSVARFFIESVTLAHSVVSMAQNSGLQRLADSGVMHKGECDDATVGIYCLDECGDAGCGDAGTGSDAAYALFC